MKQHGDGLSSTISGATVPTCSCTVYIFFSKLAVISTKSYIHCIIIHFKFYVHIQEN